MKEHSHMWAHEGCSYSNYHKNDTYQSIRNQTRIVYCVWWGALYTRVRSRRMVYCCVWWGVLYTRVRSSRMGYCCWSSGWAAPFISVFSCNWALNAAGGVSHTQVTPRSSHSCWAAAAALLSTLWPQSSHDCFCVECSGFPFTLSCAYRAVIVGAHWIICFYPVASFYFCLSVAKFNSLIVTLWLTGEDLAPPQCLFSAMLSVHHILLSITSSVTSFCLSRPSIHLILPSVHHAFCLSVLLSISCFLLSITSSVLSATSFISLLFTWSFCSISLLFSEYFLGQWLT